MLEEEQERERIKLEENLRLWEECYKRFKPRFDKFADYEKRIHELELKIENRDRMWRIVEREKKNLIILVSILTIATVILLNTLSQIKNIWVFFIVGVILGLGWATLLQVIIRLPFNR